MLVSITSLLHIGSLFTADKLANHSLDFCHPLWSFLCFFFSSFFSGSCTQSLHTFFDSFYTRQFLTLVCVLFVSTPLSDNVATPFQRRAFFIFISSFRLLAIYFFFHFRHWRDLCWKLFTDTVLTSCDCFLFSSRILIPLLSWLLPFVSLPVFSLTLFFLFSFLFDAHEPSVSFNFSHLFIYDHLSDIFTFAHSNYASQKWIFVCCIKSIRIIRKLWVRIDCTLLSTHGTLPMTNCNLSSASAVEIECSKQNLQICCTFSHTKASPL